MMNNKICKNCRYWQLEGKYGICALLTDSQYYEREPEILRDAPEPKALACATAGASYGAYFNTDEDFSCVQWKVKEADGLSK